MLWRKCPSKDMNVLLEAQWMEGFWLGRHHRIGDSDSVREAQAVQRCPEVQRWQPDLLGAVRATLWRNPAPALETSRRRSCHFCWRVAVPQRPCRTKPAAP